MAIADAENFRPSRKARWFPAKADVATSRSPALPIAATFVRIKSFRARRVDRAARGRGRIPKRRRVFRLRRSASKERGAVERDRSKRFPIFDFRFSIQPVL